jgi:hypothetical protein
MKNERQNLFQLFSSFLCTRQMRNDKALLRGYQMIYIRVVFIKPKLQLPQREHTKVKCNRNARGMQKRRRIYFQSLNIKSEFHARLENRLKRKK